MTKIYVNCNLVFIIIGKKLFHIFLLLIRGYKKVYHHATRVISVKKENLGKSYNPGFENQSSYNIYLNSIFEMDIKYQEAWFLGIIDDIV